jgi:hypothetical protein
MSGKIKSNEKNGKTKVRPPHLFKPGQSGNPLGRTKGSPSLRWFKEHIKNREVEIIDRVVDLAISGNSTAMELVVTRMVPAYQPTDDHVEVEGYNEAKTRSDKAKIISDGIGSGKVTPNQGAIMMTVLEKSAKIQEVDDLEARMKAIEEAMSKK